MDGGLSTARIYHITSEEAWLSQKNDPAYRGDTLESEGFIHCSTRDQVAATANRYYRGVHGLVLLEIDAHSLASPLRYEQVPGVGSFPHIYGPLNRDAVTQVFRFEPGLDGSFTFPEE